MGRKKGFPTITGVKEIREKKKIKIQNQILENVIVF